MNKRLLIALCSIFSLASCTHAQQVVQVTSVEAAKIIASDPKMLILDVRTGDEFKDGHIKNAINIDIKRPDALDKIGKLNHNAKYLVHCRTNHRSKIAVDHMMQSGFKTVTQMSDGFAGWSQNELPIEK